MASTKKDEIKASTTQLQELIGRNIEQQRQQVEHFSVKTQEASFNNIEYQKTLCNTFHSSYLQFLDNFCKSSENFKTSEKYYEIYNAFTKDIQKLMVGIPDSQNLINEMTVNGAENINKMAEISQRSSVENFSKMTEISRKFFSELLQNFSNFARKTERAYIQ
jgi:hypothetical protein